jgi:hypothetical protein
VTDYSKVKSLPLRLAQIRRLLFPKIKGVRRGCLWHSTTLFLTFDSLLEAGSREPEETESTLNNILES